jgi:hypothetical protein
MISSCPHRFEPPTMDGKSATKQFQNESSKSRRRYRLYHFYKFHSWYHQYISKTTTTTTTSNENSANEQIDDPITMAHHIWTAAAANPKLLSLSCQETKICGLL